MNYHQANRRFIDISDTRLKLILSVFVFVAIGIVCRLFFLQIIEHSTFVAVAKKQHTGGIKIPARRGEILTLDQNTGNHFKLATNITLDLLYVDPKETPDKPYLAKLLAPIVFNEEDYQLCLEDDKYCPQSKIDKIIDDVLKDYDEEVNDDETSDVEEEIIVVPSYEEMLIIVESNILKKISETDVRYVTVKNDLPEHILQKVATLNIPGVIVDTTKKKVAVNPMLIPKIDEKRISRVLEPLLGMHNRDILTKIQRRTIRYVPLRRKVSPEVSEYITRLKTESRQAAKNDRSIEDKLKGVVLTPEHWRFYPNENILAQSIGFFSKEHGGQYGLEEAFDDELVGKQGEILADTDPRGNAINFAEQDIVNVVNGKDLVLTIDLPVQKKVEEVLERNVKRFNAVSGQVIIMDPHTGAIRAMANYPTYNPNEYGTVFEKEKATKWDEIPEYLDVFIKNEDGTFRYAEEDEREDTNLDRYVYKNMIGTGAYKNKIIQDIYEPGSVFKPITMAIALDRNEVSPETTYLDTGEFSTDEFLPNGKEIIIKNANFKSHGIVNMTECLEQSINTCMAFIAQKLGKRFYAPLFYKYIKDFGFGEYTDIEFPFEEKGQIRFWDKWTETDLVTTSFGQGISATPLQVVTAWSALANGGLLVRPHIIDSIIYSDGEVEKTETKVVRRVISKDTSRTITAMLVSTVSNGVAHTARVKNHLIAGKTGTSQISKTNGQGYESGEGSNITSFAGYAPIHNPKFVMLVKFDRPRFGADSTWGSTTAAPTFKEISEFLFSYYNIHPDDNL